MTNHTKSLDEIYQEVLGPGARPFEYQRICGERGLPEVLDVPTGCGKTLTALISWLYRRLFHPDVNVRASQAASLVFALPMRTLCEQTVRVVEAAIAALGLQDQVDVQLAMGGHLHGKTLQEWRLGTGRPQVIVGTIDVIVSRLLMRGYGTPRSAYPIDFALSSNGVLVVVDEVQLAAQASHTLRQIQAFARQFGTFGSFDVVYMTATIDDAVLTTVDNPTHRRDPGIAASFAQDSALRRKLHASRRISELSCADAKSVAQQTMRIHESGSLTLIIVNTVKTAQDVYAALKRLKADVPLALIHSRFRPAERGPIIERILGEMATHGGIAVSTQVLEAGIDVNARTVISEAPVWFSIVQRFARCNRRGDDQPGNAFWFRAINPKAQPYATADLEATASALAGLEGAVVTTESLLAASPPVTNLPLRTIRRIDFLALFDTALDLSGRDLDVSGYIREREPLDVHLAWVTDLPSYSRVQEDTTSPPLPAPQWQCAVNITAARAFLTGNNAPPALVFDTGVQRWVKPQQKHLTPGAVILVDATGGGYDVELGFVGSTAKPKSVATHSPSPSAGSEVGPLDHRTDRAESDIQSTIGAWVTLADHSDHARSESIHLLRDIGCNMDSELENAVTVAAWAHDAGKAFAVWQNAIRDVGVQAPSEANIYAKSAGNGRLDFGRDNAGLRHEFVTAMVLLTERGQAWLTSQGVPERLHNLCVYLAGAHHGKFRMSLACPVNDGRTGASIMGVRSTDQLQALLPGTPEPIVVAASESLAFTHPAEWSALASRLLREYGPFKLAYLETVVRLADWRASALERQDS